MSPIPEILNTVSGAVMLIGVAAAVATLSSSIINLKKISNESLLLEVYAEEKKAESNIEEKSDSIGNVSLSITPGEKQLLMLERYHGQVIKQSTLSFWFSLLFAAIGFVVIITSVYSYTSQSEITNQGPFILKIIGGSIIDGVSALLFIQSNKARESMTDFFDKLRTDRRIEESLRLTESLKNDEMKDKLKTIIAMKFVNIEENDNVLNHLYNSHRNIDIEDNVDSK